MKNNKQLKVELIAICEYGLIDSTNKASIMGIFNEISVSSFPGGLPRAYFVVSLTGNVNTSYKLTISVKDEDKKDAFPPLNLEAKTSFGGRANLMINIAPLVFPHAGEFKISIVDMGKEIGSTNIQVIQAKQNEQNTKISN